MAQTVFASAGGKLRLDKIPTAPPGGITKEKARKRFAALEAELFELQDALWGAKANSVLVVLQGRDSAGKDGAIKHVAGCLNPRGVSVVSFGVPTDEERAHDFLWRVHRHAPRLGEFAIFNRSHYEDVLVVRVHGLVPAPVWQARYEQINAFERHLSQNSVTILKFCLHISRDEQRKRLLARLADPHKNWKFNANDLRERTLWDEYTGAYRDALARTGTAWAPWYVVPADRKPVRDLLIAEVVLATLERMKPAYPPVPEEVARFRTLLEV